MSSNDRLTVVKQMSDIRQTIVWRRADMLWNVLQRPSHIASISYADKQALEMPLYTVHNPSISLTGLNFRLFMQESISEEKSSDKKSDKKSDRKSDKKADVTDKEDTPVIKPNYEKNMKKIGNRFGYERNRII